MKAPGLGAFRQIPQPVWVLGLVSLFMDLSSEMIHSLLPVYLVAVLGASATEVGIIEGLAEATAMVTKIFSGALSDWIGRRKILAVAGYGLSACTKLLFPIANTIEWIVLARFLDRFGKGVRGAPRDALIADITSAEVRGASFGLRQALDTVGAFIGPLAAAAIMTMFADQYRLVFWIAVVPAFIAVLLLATAVQEPNEVHRQKREMPDFGGAGRLPAMYWIACGGAIVLTLARFSEAFLLLRSQQIGLSPAAVPLVLVAMNVVYSVTAYPGGSLSDRFGRKSLLLAGVIVLIAADLVLASAGTLATLFIGVGLWGMHMGLTQGVFAAVVADTVPPRLRGTGFGVFNLVTGVATLFASFIAGFVWEQSGSAGTFLVGAGFAALSIPVLLRISYTNGAEGEPARGTEP